VTINGKKAVGSAQRRFRGAFLLHGSILFDVDRKLSERVFGSGFIEAVSWVNAFSSVTAEEFSVVLVDSMAEEFGARFTRDALSEHEQYLKKKLSTERHPTTAPS
jgi:lipoate-protein ligase A